MSLPRAQRAVGTALRSRKRTESVEGSSGPMKKSSFGLRPPSSNADADPAPSDQVAGPWAHSRSPALRSRRARPQNTEDVLSRVTPKRQIPNISALTFRPPLEEAEVTSPAAVNKAGCRPAGRWMPTKKVSLPTMAGIKALHAEDPVAYGPKQLSLQFGISYEAVTRILKSKYREKKGGGLTGTKWDPSPMSNPGQSPVAAIREAFAQARHYKG